MKLDRRSFMKLLGVGAAVGPGVLAGGEGVKTPKFLVRFEVKNLLPKDNHRIILNVFDPNINCKAYFKVGDTFLAHCGMTYRMIDDPTLYLGFDYQDVDLIGSLMVM